MHVKIEEEILTEKIKIFQGIRQGGPLSPKLFTFGLENVFKELNWENKGINIDEWLLNHLRFADDIGSDHKHSCRSIGTNDKGNTCSIEKDRNEVESK